MTNTSFGHCKNRRQMSPVISEFYGEWKNALTNEEYDSLLKPIVPKILSSKSGREVDLRRSYMVLDWLIRTYLPTWLELIDGLKPYAEGLRSMSEVQDVPSLIVANTIVPEATKATPVVQNHSIHNCLGFVMRSGMYAAIAASGAAWASAWNAEHSETWEEAKANTGDLRKQIQELGPRCIFVIPESEVKVAIQHLQTSAAQLLVRLCEVR